jgi:hypothetical protein
MSKKKVRGMKARVYVEERRGEGWAEIGIQKARIWPIRS